MLIRFLKGGGGLFVREGICNYWRDNLLRFFSAVVTAMLTPCSYYVFHRERTNFDVKVYVIRNQKIRRLISAIFSK